MDGTRDDGVAASSFLRNRISTTYILARDYGIYLAILFYFMTTFCFCIWIFSLWATVLGTGTERTKHIILSNLTLDSGTHENCAAKIRGYKRSNMIRAEYLERLSGLVHVYGGGVSFGFEGGEWVFLDICMDVGCRDRRCGQCFWLLHEMSHHSTYLSLVCFLVMFVCVCA